MDPWRLLVDPQPAPGAWNMAVDEAILGACSMVEALPTLRLYAWSPPCLSLGVAQPLTDVDLPRLAANGWHLVRRPTGGRAVLHTDELTYSVIGAPTEPRLARGVLESYRMLAGALVATLKSLGLQADMQDQPTGSSVRNLNPVCFEVPSTYEITVDGKKIFGSAQARRREGVLQHGSLPLCGDLTRILQGLCYEDEAQRTHAAERLLAHAATVETLLGRVVTWEMAAEAMIASFQQVLQVELLPGTLTAEERAQAGILAETKYAQPR